MGIAMKQLSYLDQHFQFAVIAMYPLSHVTCVGDRHSLLMCVPVNVAMNTV